MTFNGEINDYGLNYTLFLGSFKYVLQEGVNIRPIFILRELDGVDFDMYSKIIKCLFRVELWILMLQICRVETRNWFNDNTCKELTF